MSENTNISTNELEARLQKAENIRARDGVVWKDKFDRTHTSGQILENCREEERTIEVHGEQKHLMKHAELAQLMGIEKEDIQRLRRCVENMRADTVEEAIKEYKRDCKHGSEMYNIREAFEKKKKKLELAYAMKGMALEELELMYQYCTVTSEKYRGNRYEFWEDVCLKSNR